MIGTRRQSFVGFVKFEAPTFSTERVHAIVIVVVAMVAIAIVVATHIGPIEQSGSKLSRVVDRGKRAIVMDFELRATLNRRQDIVHGPNGGKLC